MGGNNPNNEGTAYFLSHVSKTIDMYLKDFENIILLGDINSTFTDYTTNEFCQMYNHHNLINEPTCYKTPNNPSSIDVILTNRKNSFENSSTIEPGLSDHHKMIITAVKVKFKKKESQTINDFFRDELKNTVQNTYTEMDYDDFKRTFMTILNKYAPMKKKFLRGNNAPFMNKTLSQEIP